MSLKQGSMRKTIFPVIIAGAILRLWNLGKWSFWADEVFTTLDAQKFPHIFRINPVPYAVVKFFISLFGTNEWSARLGPAVCGIVAIPAVYLIASHIFSTRVGLLSALFVAFIPWHLFWSQNARAYSFAFLFSLISAGTFFLALERDKLSLLLCSLFFYLLLVLSHLLSGALLLSFIAYAVCLRFLPIEKPSGFRRRNLIVFFAPFTLPLLALTHPKLFQVLVSGWGHSVWARNPIYVLFTLIYGLTIPIAVLAGAFGLIYFLSAFRLLRKQEGERARGQKGKGAGGQEGEKAKSQEDKAARSPLTPLPLNPFAPSPLRPLTTSLCFTGTQDNRNTGNRSTRE